MGQGASAPQELVRSLSVNCQSCTQLEATGCMICLLRRNTARTISIRDLIGGELWDMMLSIWIASMFSSLPFYTSTSSDLLLPSSVRACLRTCSSNFFDLGEAEAKARYQDGKANMLLLSRHEETARRVRGDERRERSRVPETHRSPQSVLTRRGL